MQLPAGGEEGQSAAGLGGWNLAVSRYSEHPEIAADLVAYLTGEEEQKRRAIQASYNPTIDALYQDQEVLEAVPSSARSTTHSPMPSRVRLHLPAVPMAGSATPSLAPLMTCCPAPKMALKRR